MKNTGFTLIELLVVVFIIGLLATIALVSFNGVIERGKVAKAVGDSEALKTATEMYFNRMGFYPPDVGRGWDAGFLKPQPWNPDTGATSWPSCSHCPSGWETIVQTRWDGPYLQGWTGFTTPWGGKYDYNYWAPRASGCCFAPGQCTGSSRYGCCVPPGVYVGVQGYYDNTNQMSSIAEKIMVDQGIDADDCQNGEAQLILFSL